MKIPGCSLTYLSAFLCVTSSVAALRPRQASIRDCLIEQGFQADAVFPGDPAYETLATSFNRRVDFSPAAIVAPRTEEGVQNAVICGAQTSTSVVARSGGHSYAAFSLGGQDGSLVIDLTNLKSITSSGEEVTVQTGVLLGELATHLWENGQRALPHGTCPKVGTGGHTAYGGYGPFSRIGGLLSDNVVEASVVLANGTSIVANEDSNSDLFWALRGAAPSYGIVTSWKYKTYAAPPTTVFFSIRIPLQANGTVFQSSFSTYQNFVRDAPNELAMAFSFGPGGENTLGITLIGNYFGDRAAFDELVQPLLDSYGPDTSVEAEEHTDWTEVLVANAYGEALESDAPSTPDNFFAKSLVVTDTISSSALASWSNYLYETAMDADLSWWAQADLYGGGIASAPSTYSSFAHRGAFLVFQFYGSSTNAPTGPYPENGIDIVDGMVSSLSSNPSAAYPNYIDPTLTTSEWQQQYFGENLARLQSIKAAYDPNEVFKFPQSISPGTSSDTPTPPPEDDNSNAPSSAHANTTGSSALLFAIIALLSLTL